MRPWQQCDWGRGVPPHIPWAWQPLALPSRALSLPPAATAAQASLLPYFPTIIEHLRGFLVTGHEDLQPVQTQSLGEWVGGSRAQQLFTELVPEPAQVSSLLLKTVFSTLCLAQARISEFDPAVVP